MDAPPPTLRDRLRGPLLMIGILVLAGWIGLGGKLQLAQQRGPAPGLADEPFYPPPDPQAEAVLAAARRTISALAARADPLPDEQAAPEAPSIPSDEELNSTFPALADLREPERWLLSLYVPDPSIEERPWVADLTPGLSAAAQALWEELPRRWRNSEAMAHSRLKVDHIIGGERLIPYDGGRSGVALDSGLDGIVLRHPGGGEFRYLPSWSIERGVRRNRIHVDARKQSRARAGWTKAMSKEASFAAFRSRAHVESRWGGGPAVAVARGNIDIAGVNASSLREAIAVGIRYLVRETDERGKITYEYDAVKDEEGSGYNMLRHAGTLYSMLQAYRVRADPKLLAAAKRAADYYISRLDEDDQHPGELYVVDDRKAKLGGIGLGLLALTELEKAVPGSVEVELLYGMAAHIERQQNDDGSFESYFPYDSKPVSGFKSIFYSGEAILGLLHMHQLTGDDRSLRVAIRGADYLVHRRWRALGIELNVPPDAWLLQALEELDRVAPDEDRADYAFELATRIAMGKLMDPDTTPPDLLGGDLAGLKNLPNICTAGSYGEALAAGARLEARRRPGDHRIRTWAERNAGFQLRHQYVEANSWYLPNPDRALGAWRLKPDDGEIRNDYVQHNVSGLFGLLQLLDPKAPDIGWVVPEQQRPRRKAESS